MADSSSVRRTHYTETSRQNKTACPHEHQEEKLYRKRTATSYMYKRTILKLIVSRP